MYRLPSLREQSIGDCVKNVPRPVPNLRRACQNQTLPSFAEIDAVDNTRSMRLIT